MFFLINEMNRLMHLGESIKNYLEAPTSHKVIQKKRGRPRKRAHIDSPSTSSAVAFLSAEIEEYDNVLVCARRHSDELNNIVTELIVDENTRPLVCRHIPHSSMVICQGIPDTDHQFCGCGLYLSGDGECLCRKGLNYRYSPALINDEDLEPGPSHIYDEIDVEE
ncbi:uncharacterized protein LOC127279942 [Leptopilina boulardi]|uniref:uncharacterized protein LOC127279942 n=1 Tax=Leptopilina boulardi TaxID=63433 RepID=UPI0021F53583|nr:uncharacterized protein LOC127279942 [Leptopilina boulardi]